MQKAYLALIIVVVVTVAILLGIQVYKSQPADPNYAAQNGDTVNIDYVGTVDGVEFDGGSAEDYDLVLGSGSFIPGFEDQLIGAKAQETVTVEVTFPEDYGSPDLAGQDAIFEVKVNDVYQQ